MTQYDVAVVGEIYIDHIFTGFTAWPQPGEEAFARQYHQEIGGGAANTACALGRLGRTVDLVGVIGSSDAAWFEQRLLEFGVAGNGVCKTDGNTGVTVSVSMVDDRTFFTYAGENEKLIDILRSDTVLASLTRARHVHFALPLDRDLANDLLPILRNAGCTISLDVGFQQDWLSDPGNLETCRATDYFLPNEREAYMLCGCGGAAAYLAFAQKNGLTAAVIKLGSHGAAMQMNGTAFKVASPVVKVVDTTGAGDAFNAGFIDAVLDKATPEECLRRACICGGLSTRVAGALRALPGREEVMNIYAETYAS